MMSYLTARLRRVFRPAGEHPLPEADDPDPIAIELQTAVQAHVAAGRFAAEEHALLVQASIDDLLKRLGPHN